MAEVVLYITRSEPGSGTSWSLILFIASLLTAGGQTRRLAAQDSATQGPGKEKKKKEARYVFGEKIEIGKLSINLREDRLDGAERVKRSCENCGKNRRRRSYSGIF